MINALAKFANSIKDKELERIESYLKIITHPVTRGDMFEGATGEIIKKTIGALPEIHVCEGFVKNYRTGQLSKQMDIIIYINECEDIPDTTSKIVSIDNTLAIIEVKKDLDKKELFDFYEKQASIYELADKNCPYDKELFSMIKKQVFGKIKIDEEVLKKSSKLEFFLYHVLRIENSQPLRICIGFDGFSKETTLRDNLWKVILERQEKGLDHTGMNSLPTLVISEDNCLVKMIGMPFAVVYNDPYSIMQSYKGDVIKVLMSMLLAKIESRTSVRFEYECEDFATFIFNNYLAVGINEADNSTQYYICPLTTKDSKKNMYAEKEWAPVEITKYEYIVAYLLCALSHEQDPRISEKDELFTKHNLSIDLKNLIRNRFISIHDGYVEMTSIECQLAIYDGKYWIGENVGGQMNTWYLNLIKKNMDSDV